MFRRCIIDDMGVGEFLGLYARRGKIKEMAGSHGRMYVRSLLPIYCQIGRMRELEFGYATLCAISNIICMKKKLRDDHTIGGTNIPRKSEPR
jgi:hypothetical protein